jgi:hypothetical protein
MWRLRARITVAALARGVLWRLRVACDNTVTRDKAYSLSVETIGVGAWPIAEGTGYISIARLIVMLNLPFAKDTPVYFLYVSEHTSHLQREAPFDEWHVISS